MKPIFFLLCLFGTLLARPVFSQLSLVKDVNTTPSNQYESLPSGLVEYKGILYYTDDVRPYGRELWRTDGTPEGTYLFKDIAPGMLSSAPANFAEINGILYFSADDGIHGQELWTTDGTAAGTVLLKDINPGMAGSRPVGFVQQHDVICFRAYHATSGLELWRTDGTTAGTSLVKDIYPGLNGSGHIGTGLVPFRGQLYFGAAENTYGRELWTTDGTTQGTTLVKDLLPGAKGPEVLYPTAFNNHLYFVTFDTAGHGASAVPKQLWKSDGTATGTAILLNSTWSGRQNNYAGLLASDKYLYFESSPYSDNSPRRLHRTDGTSVATVAESSATTNFSNVVLADGDLCYTTYKTFDWESEVMNQEFHFYAIDEETGDMTSHEQYSFSYVQRTSTSQTTVYPDDVVRVGTDAWLWLKRSVTSSYTSGTTWEETLMLTKKGEGTRALQNMNYFGGFIPYKGRFLVFASIGPDYAGVALYSLDPASGTMTAINHHDAVPSAWPSDLRVVNDKILFGTGQRPALWTSDGTEAGTQPISLPGDDFSGVFSIHSEGRYTYVTGMRGSTSGLWQTDGTAAGTVPVLDAVSRRQLNDMNALAVLGSKSLFYAADGTAALWSHAGGGAGAVKLKELGYSAPVSLVRNTSGTLAYFSFIDDAHGSELWVTDGTAAGTRLVKDIVPGSVGNVIQLRSASTYVNCSMINDILYFSVYAGQNQELWRSDGTDAGTYRLHRFEEYSYLMNFYATADNRLFLTNSNQSLWVSDGTEAGTRKVRDFPFEVIDGNASGPTMGPFLTAKSELYFFYGTGLWKTDGTEQGTSPVAVVDNYVGGSTSLSISEAVPYHDNILFITNSSYDNRSMLWTTDGTQANTYRIDGVREVRSLLEYKGALYFGADGPEGVELWKYATAGNVTDVRPDDAWDMQVYPNPSSQAFVVVVPDAHAVREIEVFDMQGRTVPCRITVQSDRELAVWLDARSTGIYFLSVPVGNHRVVKRLVKL